eukprot:4502205-Prymnesium_polylepis.2
MVVTNRIANPPRCPRPPQPPHRSADTSDGRCRAVRIAFLKRTSCAGTADATERRSRSTGLRIARPEFIPSASSFNDAG